MIERIFSFLFHACLHHTQTNPPPFSLSSINTSSLSTPRLAAQNNMSAEQPTRYDYCRDWPKARGPHNRYIIEGFQVSPFVLPFSVPPLSPSPCHHVSMQSLTKPQNTEAGGYQNTGIPEPCPCQEDSRLSTRQPLRNALKEENFWMTLHQMMGERTTINMAWFIDEVGKEERDGSESRRLFQVGRYS